MKILITGAAGFIGHQLVKLLLQQSPSTEIVGLDSINDYYDIELKYFRLADTGINHTSIHEGKLVQSSLFPTYRFIRLDLTNHEGLSSLFSQEHFTHVCNLAGQAGVRYSIENPYSYIQSNVVGFLNILECCRHAGVQHLAYASSSSVYGMNKNYPFSESDATDTPVSLYSASKKSDELMAFSYSKLYGIQTTALRFFTVYGPWGRPDMAPFKFMRKIIAGETIQVYNNGKMYRDFTYISDIVKCVSLILSASYKGDEVPARVYNIGRACPVSLMDFIHTIEQVSHCKAKMEMLGMQPGDVFETYADTSKFEADFGFKPSVSLSEGLSLFYDWFIKYQSMAI